ncbi:unnamed protein product [Prorocentrum cordatum]|uniref:Uncharacterized protein n=1 Tax=Prorocentrum cordatum TaxID=2364126 RepID=A0ABN9QXL4_9DINO|nr:unnamed protein product [Polarella glacialis]
MGRGAPAVLCGLLLAALLEAPLPQAAPLPLERRGGGLPAAAGPRAPDLREQSLVQLARNLTRSRCEKGSDVVLAESASPAELSPSASSMASSSANGSDPDSWQRSIPLEGFGDLGGSGIPGVDPAKLYDRFGLLAELHMPGAILEEIRSGSHGSLAGFLGKLHGALCAAARVDRSRLLLIGLHGRYQQIDGANVSGDRGERLGPEVLVKLQLTPAAAPATQASNAAEVPLPPSRLFSRLRDELQLETSALRRGDLGAILRGAPVNGHRTVARVAAGLAVRSLRWRSRQADRPLGHAGAGWRLRGFHGRARVAGHVVAGAARGRAGSSASQGVRAQRARRIRSRPAVGGEKRAQGRAWNAFAW